MVNNMKLERKDLLLYAITDGSHLIKQAADGSTTELTLLEEVRQALSGKATMLQLREKNMPLSVLEAEALQIQALCHEFKIPFIIDDNVELAVRIRADGVHVGQSDMEASKVRQIIGNDMILGVTARNVDEAIKAEKAGADYLGSGAVFMTGTKADTRPMTYKVLSQICAGVNIPVVAIGGITADNVGQLAGSGIAGAAVSAGIFACNDITEGTSILRKKIISFIN